MSSVINGEMINSLLTLPESEAYQKLSELNARLATVSNFQSVDTNTRKNIVKMIELGVNGKPSMIAPALELIRILARDKRQLDLLLTESVRLFIVCASSLCENGLKIVQATSFLLERLTVFTKADYSGKYDWIKNVPEESRNAIWLFDLRIAFLISAYSNNIQLLWGSSSSAISLFINIIHQYIAAVNEVNESKSEKIDVRISNACDRAAEAAKVLFNITYKRTAVLDQCFTNEITEIVVALIKGPNISPVMEQHAVNLLATLNLNMDLLCPKVPYRYIMPMFSGDSFFFGMSKLHGKDLHEMKVLQDEFHFDYPSNVDLPNPVINLLCLSHSEVEVLDIEFIIGLIILVNFL
ncbi:hypothetical protein DICVIV_01567 [Dictyocaulus viviparus]|uniref:Uncharacterized protein n=1 Tax=Dictyocaulus viviparus TaxID=29172 RepID=A0A0D8Y8E5_DICVI|nr:hypothetical protein DICVIV_01567 [Dictyocaulus viviparus]